MGRRISRRHAKRLISAPEQLEFRRLLTGEVSGFVYFDTDDDGNRDAKETGVSGVLVTLTGETTDSEAVLRRVLTDDKGAWKFGELAPGTYQVREQQPADILDGTDRSPTSGPINGNDLYTNIVVEADEVFEELNFGEGVMSGDRIGPLWLLASSGHDFVREIRADSEQDQGNTQLAEAIREKLTDVDGEFEENESPVAAADTYTMTQSERLTVVAEDGVLVNDTDANGDNLTATLVDGADNGSVVLRADGSFDYTPEPTFFGMDSFTYRASDGSATSEETTVSITVENLNAFEVSANAVPGTVIGTVLPVIDFSGATIFELTDNQIDDALHLLPDDHLKGNEAGSVVLIEYADYG